LGSTLYADTLVILEAAEGWESGNRSVTAPAQSHSSAPAGGSMGHLWAWYLACQPVGHKELHLII